MNGTEPSQEGFDPSLVDAETSFTNPAEKLEILQTHISWIVLTGSIAYKVKKPVDLGFLDFSTLAKRLEYCQRELSINRRFAPQLYRRVVPIVRVPSGLRFDGVGSACDYAVEMIQFPHEALLDERLRAGQITPQQMTELAELIAQYHATAPIVEKARVDDEVHRLTQPIIDNFSYFDDHLAVDQNDRLSPLRDWTTHSLRIHASTIRERIVQGKVRQCHGDLHLRNLLHLDDSFLAFDAIEFNDQFREIDTMNELAFLAMDLDDRGYTSWARVLLNHYLEVTGDYEGLRLLRLYMVYRALVRAKVSLIQALQQQNRERDELTPEGWTYVEHALRYAHPQPPTLAITHGVSGSGKSTGARHWVMNHGGIQLRSDVIRKQLTPDNHSTDAGLNRGRYSQEMTEVTYGRLVELSRMILESGYSVIVDAACLQRWQRDLFAQLAKDLQIQLQVLDFTASPEVLRRRVAERENDASEATLEVLEQQLRTAEPLTNQEQQWIVDIADFKPST